MGEPLKSQVPNKDIMVSGYHFVAARYIRSLLIQVAVFVFVFGSCSNGGGLPTGVPDAAVANKLRQLVAESDEARELWEMVRHRAEIYLEDEPGPLREIHYEGILNNHPDRIASVEHLYDMMRVEIWLSAWLITEDNRYAEAMRRYIVAWAETYRPDGNPINENKLDPLLTAAVVLIDSLEEKEKEVVVSWLREMAEAEISTAEMWPWSTENNWHPKRLKIVALAAEATGNDSWRYWVVAETRRYIARSLRADGSSRDFEERDALSYHIGGVRPLLRLISLLPEKYRLELYAGETVNGASVARSVEFVVPYAIGELTHGEFLKSSAELDRERAKAGLEMYQPGRPFDPLKAISLFQLAGAFDKSYNLLVGQVAGCQDKRYYDWVGVLAEAGWLIESMAGEFKELP